jgi:hypothetical protein
MGTIIVGKSGKSGNTVENGTTLSAQGIGNETNPSEPPPEPRIGATERLTIELARLRSKFGADPATAGTSLDDAWTSPTAAMEEDEAEFIDAVADCLGVGLSLDAALTCWNSGGLFYDNADQEEDETESSLPDVSVASHHGHATGRRLVVQ